MKLVSLTLTFPAPGFSEQSMLYYRVENDDGWGKTQNLIGELDSLIIASSLFAQGESGIEEAFTFIFQGKQAGKIRE